MIIRQAYYVKPGSIGNLKIQKETIELPLDREVLVRVKSIGLNFADVFCCLGLYEAAPNEKFIPGLEFSGVIEKVGTKVIKFKPGDRVMGVSRFGAYTTHININEDYILNLPSNWTFREGSGYLVQVLTAYYGMVELGSIKEGQQILIHSGAGGVGIWANRIAKKYNCRTIGVVGNKDKFDILEKENYDDYFIRNEKSFGQDLKKAMDHKPLNMIMDSIGGAIMKAGYKQLAPMGRLIAFGSAHYTGKRDRPNYLRLLWKYIRRPKLDVQNMIGENKSVMAFNLIYLFDHAEMMHRMLDELKQLDLGKPVIGSTFDFQELPDALRKLQDGNTIGKVTVTI